MVQLKEGAESPLLYAKYIMVANDTIQYYMPQSTAQPHYRRLIRKKRHRRIQSRCLPQLRNEVDSEEARRGVVREDVVVSSVA